MKFFTVNLTPGIQINCSPVKGNDGYNLMAQTNPELLAGSKYNEGMFATNIPGIYYSVKVKTSDTGIGRPFWHEYYRLVYDSSMGAKYTAGR